ncbi:ATP-binding protein [Actinoplanes sp. NPDC023801]|uniref:sensor histidine kinase n=1 Tax=Actinoplanes sp. NPDC023801 TaxID=3154595 RepID=UPI0033C72D58
MSSDAAARMVARLLGAPMVVISADHPDGERLLGAFGLPRTGPLPRIGGPSRRMTVGDLLADRELAAHPLVTILGARSLAMVPVPADPQRELRTLTVLDTAPRAWSATDLTTLTEVAALLGADAGPETTLSGLFGPIDDRTMVPAAQAHAQRGFITALLDSLQVGVVAVGVDRRPVLFNRTLRRFCDLDASLSPAAAMAAISDRLRHPDGTPNALDDLALIRALAGNSVRDVETVLRTPGAPDRYALTNGEPIHGASGELLGALCTVQDVTERRRRERFRDCELLIMHLLADADDLDEVAIPLLRALGTALGWPHVALFLVDEVADVLRTAAHWSAPGVHVDDLVPERIPRGDAGPGRVWASGRPLWIPDLTDPRYTGTPAAYGFAHAAAERGLRASLTVPVCDGEQVLGVLATLCATTEYDEFLLTGLLDGVAAQLGQFLTRRRSRDLAMQLHRTQDDFLTPVGHELRTPLTSIISYSTLLTDEIDDPEQQQMIGAIRRNVDHLQRIIDDLLELTALESGHHRIRPGPTDLTAVVAAVVAGLSAPAGVTVRTEMPPALQLEADEEGLRQIVGQLLSNAVKYSPDGGDIVNTASGEDPAVAELAVADSGIGIPAADREHLYTRFHRGANARHTAILGNGLGLPLVRGLVEAHGGTISLDPGHRPGTRIVVRLPRCHRN